MLIFFFGTNQLNEILKKISEFSIFYNCFIFFILSYLIYFFLFYFIDLYFMSFKRRIWYLFIVWLFFNISLSEFFKLGLIFTLAIKFSNYKDRTDAGITINPNVRYKLLSDHLWNTKWDFMYKIFTRDFLNLSLLIYLGYYAII